MSDIGKKIYKGTIWSVFDNFFRQIVSFVVFIILARILEPSVFGLLSVSILIVHVFSAVTFNSISTSIVRKEKPSLLDYNTGFWLCLCLSIPAFLFLFFTAGSIEIWMGMTGLERTLQGISLIILTDGLSKMHQAWLTHKMDFKALAIRSTVSVVIGGGAGVILAIKGYGVEAIVAQHLVTSLSELILLWIITPWRPKPQFSKLASIEIFNFGKHVALTGITNFANQNSDAFFVSYYLGATATGFYTTGKRISNTLNMVLSSALMRVSLPAFSRLQNDDIELRKAYLNSTSLTAMVTAPIFIGLAVLAEDITILVLGDKWLKSIPIMQILTVIGFLTSIGYYNQSIMLAKNRPQWQTRLTLLYAISNIVAFVVFTPFGLIYTAVAYAGRALLLYPISVWCAITLTNIKGLDYIKTLFPSVFSASLMALIIYSVSIELDGLSVAIRIAVLIPLGAFVYLSLLYVFMPKSYRKYMIWKYYEKTSGY